MRFRQLGKTGLQVSELSIGTVSLGTDYGIRQEGDFGCPDENEVGEILFSALDAGVNLFDTAPAYGLAEERLGRFIGDRRECLFATKVSVPTDDNGTSLTGRLLADKVQTSLDRSKRNLRRDILDIVQIHNAKVEVIRAGEFPSVLCRARDKGDVRLVGATVYTEDEAIAAIESGLFDMIQIAFNILDQRKLESAIPLARKRGVGVLSRSTLLKGALSPKFIHLPKELAGLANAVRRVLKTFDIEPEELPMTALRFSLGVPGIDSVLMGIRTLRELDQATQALKGPVMDQTMLELAYTLSLQDERLLNPSHWPLS